MPISSNSPNSISLNIGASVSGAVEVTSSVQNPVWVTGSIVTTTQASGTFYVTEGSVAGIGQLPPQSATWIGGVNDSGTISGVHIDDNGFLGVYVSGGIVVTPGTGTQSVTGTVHIDNAVLAMSQTNMPATQSVYVVNAQGSDVRITGSTVTLQVTASQANPVWVTGTDLSVSIKNSTVVLSAALGSTVGTGALAPATATMGGYVDPAGNLMPATVINGAQNVHITGALAVVDPGNSTTATLAGNASFTGTGVDTLGYASIAYNLVSDVTGATDGIQLQFSPDNINWETIFTRNYGIDRVGNNTDLVFRPHARYYRIIYKNGLAPQGTFRLQTILANYGPLADTVGVDRNVSAGQDALIVKAVIAGKNIGDNNYHDAQLDQNNALQVAGAETLTDGYQNPTNAVNAGAFLFVWDPVAQVWNRLNQGDADQDGDVGSASGMLEAESYNKYFNGFTWDRMRGDQEGMWVKVVGTGSGGIAVSQSNVPATQSVYVVNSQGSNVNITGTITLPVSQTNVPATQSVYVVNAQGSDVRITGSTITLPVSQTNPVLTASVSVSNFPATQTVTASIASPVSVANIGTVTVSQSNVPAGVLAVSQSNVPAGTLTVSQSNTPAGTQTVSMSNWPAGATVSQSNIPAGAFTVTASLAAPLTVAVSGIAGVSQSNIPAGTMNVTGTVGVFNTVTTSQSNIPAGTVTVSQSNPVLTASVSVSNFPATQTVTGSVGVWNAVQTSQSNIPAGTVTVSQTNPVLTASVSVSNFPATQTVTGSIGVWNTLTVSQSNLPAGAMQVTSSNANPVWITGVLTTVQSASGTFFVTEASVGGVGQQAPISATLLGAHDTTGNLSTLHTDAQSNLLVSMTGILAVSQTNVPATQSVFIVNSQGSDVRITGSTVTLPVSQTNPVLTASVSVSNFPASQTVTGSVGVWNTVAVSQTLPITASISNFPAVQQVSQSNIPAGTVTVSQSNPVLTASVSVSNFPASQTVTGSVGVWNTVGVSQSNIPAGTVTVSQSNPVTTASISNFPTGFNVNVTASITQSMTGTVGVWNTVTTSQSNVPAGVHTVSQSNIPAGTVTVSQSNPVTTASISNFPTGFNVNLTSSITQSVTGTVGVWNTVGVSQSNIPAGTVTVSQSNPVLTASVSVSNFPASQTVTGTVGVWNTVAVSATNPVLTASVSVSNFPATQTMTGTVGVWNTVTVSQSNTPAGIQTVSQSNPVLTASVSVSNFPASQTVTGSMGVWNTVAVSATNPVLTASVSVSNFPASQTVTGSMGVWNTVAVSATNPVLTASVSVSNFPTTQTVTGSVGVWNAVQTSQSNIPAGTVTVSQTNPVLTASVSVSNFPATQTVTGSVGVWNSVQTSQSNIPAGTVTVSQTNPVLTASVSVSNFPATQTVTGSVGVWNTITVSQSNLPAGTVTVSQSNPVLTASVSVSNFPATQTVTGTVGVWNSVTVSQSNIPAGITSVSQTNPVLTASVSVSNFPAVQTVTGSILSVVQSASVVGNIAVLGGTVSMPVGSSAGIAITITGSFTGTLDFQASFDNGQSWWGVEGYGPYIHDELVWERTTTTGVFIPYDIGGATHVRVSASAWGGGSAGVTINGNNITPAVNIATRENGDPAPTYGTMIGGDDLGTFRYVAVDVSGALKVTSSYLQPVWITGVITSVQSATGSFYAIENSVGGTNQLAPASATFVGGYNASNLVPFKVDAQGQLYTIAAASSGSNVNITGSTITLTVSQSNVPAGTQTVSQSNIPAGAFTVTASIASPVSVAMVGALSAVFSGTQNVTGSVGVWNALTGTVGVWNTVTTSQSNVPAGTVTVSQSNPVLTASVSVSNFPASQTVTGSVGVWNAVQVSQSNTPAGTQTVSMSNWPAGATVSQSNIPAGAFTVTASLVAPVSVFTPFSAPSGVVAPTTGALVAGRNPLTNITNLISAHGTDFDAEAVQTFGALEVDAHLKVFNGTTWDRVRSLGTGIVQVSSTLAAPLTVAISGTPAFSMSNASTLTVSQSNTPAGTQTVSQSNIPAGNFQVSQSNIPAGAFTVTSTLAAPATVALSGTGTVTGSVGVWNALTGTVGVWNALTGTVGVWNTLTGTMGVWNVVQTSQSNIPAGTVTVSQTNPVLTASVSVSNFPASQTVTGSVGVWNTVGVSQSNIPAGTVSVSQTNPVLTASVSVSNFPASQTVTGSVGVWNSVQTSQSNVPAGTVTVSASLTAPLTVALSGTGTITGSVGVWNAVQVSQSNTPAGTQTVSQSNIPAGAFTVTSTLAAPATVAVSGTASVSMSAFPAGTVTVSQSNWPAGATGTFGVWNVVQTSQSNVPAGTVTVTAALASPVTVAVTGILAVSQTNAAAAGGGTQYGTGSTTPYTGTIALAVSGAAAVALSASNVSGALWVQIPQSQVVAVSQTNALQLGVITVTSSIDTPVWTAISGVMNVVFSGTQVVTGTVHIDNSGSGNAVWVTGTVVTSQSNIPAGNVQVSMSNWPAGATVSQSNVPAGAFTVTATLAAPATVALSGTGTITGSVGVWNALTGTVGVWNAVQVSQSNTPAGTQTVSQSNIPAGNFQVSQSNIPAGAFTVTSTLAAPATVALSGTGTVTGTVGVWNALTGTVGVWNALTGTVGVWNALTGTVGVWNIVQVSQSNTPAGTQTVSQSNIPAGAFTVTSTLAAPATVALSGTGTITGSVGVWNALTGTVGVWNTVTVSQSNQPAGTITVTSSQASPVWITQSGGGSSVSVTNTASITASSANPVSVAIIGAISAQNPAAAATGSANPPSGSVTLGVYNGTAQYLSASSIGYLGVTATLDNPVTVALSGGIAATITGVMTVTATTDAPISVAIVGAAPGGGGTQYATGTATTGGSGTLFLGVYNGTAQYLSATNLGALLITGTVSQSNVPAGVWQVSQSNTPAGTQTVSQSNIPAGTLTVSMSNAPAQTFTVSATNYPAATGTFAPPASNTPVIAATSVTGAFGVVILAANQARLGATIQNIATGTAGVIHVKLGDLPTLGSYTVRMAQNGYYEVPFNYKGIITAICSASITASVITTELRA